MILYNKRFFFGAIFFFFFSDNYNGKFDLGDRIFNNISYTWNLSMTYDCKELIPELFYVPEMFFNLNEFDFGHTQGKQKVSLFNYIYILIYR